MKNVNSKKASGHINISDGMLLAPQKDGFRADLPPLKLQQEKSQVGLAASEHGNP